jgi:60 kDa SS-A/Ro ribonucleoprotein
VPSVVAALDRAFYMAFANVESSGKRTMVALDVSGSMDSRFQDSSLSVREASGRPWPWSRSGASRITPSWRFARGFVPLDISAADSLATVVEKTSRLGMDGTDCAQPMLFALRRKIPVDVFAVYTDNETWAGRMHPPAALQLYRKEMKIPAKLIVVGMTSSGFSIADPNDGGMLDVVGFDSSAPSLIADFARG